MKNTSSKNNKIKTWYSEKLSKGVPHPIMYFAADNKKKGVMYIRTFKILPESNVSCGIIAFSDLIEIISDEPNTDSRKQETSSDSGSVTSDVDIKHKFSSMKRLSTQAINAMKSGISGTSYDSQITTESAEKAVISGPPPEPSAPPLPLPANVDAAMIDNTGGGAFSIDSSGRLSDDISRKVSTVVDCKIVSSNPFDDGEDITTSGSGSSNRTASKEEAPRKVPPPPPLLSSMYPTSSFSTPPISDNQSSHNTQTASCPDSSSVVPAVIINKKFVDVRPSPMFDSSVTSRRLSANPRTSMAKSSDDASHTCSKSLNVMIPASDIAVIDSASSEHHSDSSVVIIDNTRCFICDMVLSYKRGERVSRLRRELQRVSSCHEALSRYV